MAKRRGMSFRVDMHIHTRLSSPCSLIDPERLIWAAKRSFLDGICVTDHDGTDGAELVYELGTGRGFPVFRGFELYTEYGDMLVFGLSDFPTSWLVPFDELVDACAKAGGIIIPAHFAKSLSSHPEEGRSEIIARVLPRVAAIETHNGGSSFEDNELVSSLAREYGVTGIGGSDAHHEFQIGRCFTVFDEPVLTERALIEAVSSGACRGEYDPRYMPLRP